MKKVITLSESDLRRIVKKVLNEQTSEVVKVKVFLSPEDKQKGVARAFNLDITNIKLRGQYVWFEYSTPGGGNQTAGRIINRNGDNYSQQFTISKGTGSIRCGSNNNDISLTESGSGRANGIQYTEYIEGDDGYKFKGYGRQNAFYLSTEGKNKLHKLCNQYASIDNETSNSDMV